MKRLLPLVLAAWALVPATVSNATDLRHVLIDYSVASWTAKDGLPDGTIASIAQDRDGYLWLGGDFGLLRFDGVRFVEWEWNLVGQPALEHVRVDWLCSTPDGSLWVALGGRGSIVRVRNGQVSSYEGFFEGGGAVSALFADARGVVWAARSGSLYKFDHERWTQVHDDAFATNRILTASVTPTGSMLAVTQAGVFRRGAQEDRFRVVERAGFTGNPIHAVTEDTFSRDWITDRITGFRPVGARREPGSETESGKGLRLLSDRRGNVWVATFGQGLWRVSVDQAQHTTTERVTDLTGLASNVVNALYEDRDGNIWAGTTNGLNRLTPHRVTHIAGMGLVTGLEVTNGGTVWAGTANSIRQLSATSGVWRDWPLGRDRLDAMTSDPHGTLWIAAGSKLLHFDGSSTGPRLDTDRLSQVKALSTDGRNGVWLWDVDGGLMHWTGTTLTHVELPSELQHARLSGILTDHHDRLWVATTNERLAVRDDSGGWHVYPRPTASAGGWRTVYEDDAGIVWLAGRRGLTRFSGDAFMTMSAPGVSSQSVTGVIDDGKGSLWVGTASGIVRMRRSDAQRQASDQDAVQSTLYDSADGIAGTTGWIGQRSAIRTADGRVWFLTAEGVAIIDPAALDRATTSSSARIDGVVVNDKKLPATPSMIVGPGATRLEIDYTVLNIATPRRTRFRYRLEGFDQDWVDAGPGRQAVYTNLAPRSYRFSVQANDERGTWSAASADWTFSVRPAFYQTNWFMALCVTTFCAGAWTVWQLRIRHVRRRFSILLGERVRLSRELHDTLLQSLVGVALQLDILQRDVTEAPARARFQQVRQQLEEYIREARQSIWNLRSSALQQQDLVTALRQYGERAADHRIAFNLTVVGAARPCEPQLEEQILRIGQEAVFNAIRHAQANRIDVELEYADATISLRVSDDGLGFDASRKDLQVGHWGVQTMQERAEMVGGHLDISTGAGRGTRIEATIPLAA